MAASYMGFKEVNERSLKMVADGLAPKDCEKDGYMHNNDVGKSAMAKAPGFAPLVHVKDPKKWPQNKDFYI